MASRVRRWSAHRRPRTGSAGIIGSIRSHIASVITHRTDTSDQPTNRPRRHALAHLIADRGFPPWGVVVARDKMLQGGGGAVAYLPQQAYDELPSSVRHWAVPVRTDGTFGDWTDEPVTASCREHRDLPPLWTHTENLAVECSRPHPRHAPHRHRGLNGASDHGQRPLRLPCC